MADSSEAVRALDVKITATEQEFERLRELLAEAESNLQVLRRAKALLLADGGEAPEARPLPREGGTDEGHSATEHGAVATVHGPIATIILDVMREGGKPVSMSELIERLRARGRDADTATITNAVAQLVKAGKLWRTAPKTFALPKGVGF